MIRLMMVLVVFSCQLRSEELFEAYYDNNELSSLLEGLQSKYLTKSVLTQTAAGNRVHCLKLTDSESRKPAMLILGDTNPSSPVGAQILLLWLQGLLADEQELAELLKSYSLYVIPRPFPDALATFFGTVKYESKLNSTAVDDDKDLSINEDGYEDLNEDGFITLMRIKDEDGEFAEHKDSPLLMVKASEKKQPLYRIITEGIDNDKDEKFNEDPPGGVNPNKNFSFAYPYFDSDAGLHQMSERESLAIAEFAFKHPEIFVVFSFGREDNLLTPWKEDKEKKKEAIRSTIYKEDEAVFELYSKKYKKVFKVDEAPGTEPIDPAGSLAYWAYYHFGRISLTASPWQLPLEEVDGDFEEAIKEVKWLQKNRPQSMVPWEKFDHPDFPGKEVEIGGLKPFYKLIPDMKVCQQKAVMFGTFVKEVSQLKPELSVREFSLSQLGGGLCRVRLRVRNTGTLPLVPMIGQKSGQMYPLNVELTIPESWELYQGRLRQQLASLGVNEEKELSWLLVSDGGQGSLDQGSVEVRLTSLYAKDIQLKATGVK